MGKYIALSKIKDVYIKGSKNYKYSESEEHAKCEPHLLAMNLHLKSKINPLNPLSVNPTKWSKTLKQFVGFVSFCRQIECV